MDLWGEDPNCDFLVGTRRQATGRSDGEPPVLLGDNECANPVEFPLHALAGCVTTTTVCRPVPVPVERVRFDD